MEAGAAEAAFHLRISASFGLVLAGVYKLI